MKLSLHFIINFRNLQNIARLPTQYWYSRHETHFVRQEELNGQLQTKMATKVCNGYTASNFMQFFNALLVLGSSSQCSFQLRTKFMIQNSWFEICD